jgi:cytosine/adenosine deaminase-related metal-dependent hydrolase
VKSLDDLRISAASGLIGPELEFVERPTISIENGRIVAIDQGGPSDLHLSEALLIPGLINAHTHLGDSALKEVGFGKSGWEIVMPPDGVRHVRLRGLARQELIDSMAASARYMLQHGVVAFGDFREQGVDGVTALIEATSGLAIEPMIYGRHAAPPPHSDDDFVRDARLPAGYADEVGDVLEIAQGFSVVTANDTTDAGLKETSDLVRSHGGRLAVHAVEDARYRDESVRRTGRGDVARIVDCLRPDHIVHMTAANDEELDLVAEARIPVVVCPRMQAVLGNGIPPVLAMLDRGIEVALGTDNAMLTSPDPLREMDFLSRSLRALHRNPSCPAPVKVLQMATVNAARALGIDDRTGSISEGRDATFASIRLSGDSLVGTSDPVAAVVSRAEASDVAALVIRGMLVAGQLPATR